MSAAASACCSAPVRSTHRRCLSSSRARRRQAYDWRSASPPATASPCGCASSG
jgi:hypothetical protein